MGFQCHSLDQPVEVINCFVNVKCSRSTALNLAGSLIDFFIVVSDKTGALQGYVLGLNVFVV